MKITLNILIILALLVAAFDLGLSRRKQEKIKSLIFDAWAFLHEYKAREVIIYAVKLFLIRFEFFFGARAFGLKLFLRVGLINFFIIFSIFSVSVGGAYYKNFNINVSISSEMQQKHIKTLEKTIREYKEDTIESKTARAWLQRVERLTPEEYQELSYVTFVSRSSYTSIIALICSWFFSYLSAGTTFMLLRKVSHSYVFRIVFIDILLAFVLSLASLTGITLFMAGFFFETTYFYFSFDWIYTLAGWNPNEVQGIFPKVGDNVFGAQKFIEILGFWDFLFFQWSQIFDSMTEIFKGNWRAVDLTQGTINWSIGLSVAPTLVHLVFSFFLVGFWSLEKWLKEPLSKTFAWLHDHPKGPLAIFAFILGGCATILRVTLV